MTERLLEVRDLRIEIDTRRGPATIVDGINLHVDAGETLGIVGESGCGKSLTMLSLLRLLPNKIRVAGRRAVPLRRAVRWLRTSVARWCLSSRRCATGQRHIGLPVT